MYKLAGNTDKKIPARKRFFRHSADDLLHRLAFDNSLLANIITTVSTGKIIIANNAACKLLGYSMDELLSKTRADIFDTKQSSFKKMLKQRTAEGHSTALITAMRKDGSVIPCEITSAVFMDDNGTEKAITTIADMSKSMLTQKNIDIEKDKVVADNIIKAQLKSDTRLANNNEWIKYIAKASYDVMWDWDIGTGEIYVGDSVEEIFGYKVENNTVYFKNLSKCLLKHEKTIVKKRLRLVLKSAAMNWDDSFMFTRYDGSAASTVSRASIIRNDDNKAIRMIGAMQDISRIQELEKRLTDTKVQQPVAPGNEKTDGGNIPVKSKKKNNAGKGKAPAADALPEQENGGDIDTAEKANPDTRFSFDGIWDWDLLTNNFFSGNGFEELSDDAINNTGNMDDWTRYLHPDDKELIEKKLVQVIVSPAIRWQYNCRFIRNDGSVASITGRASIIRNAAGKAYRIIGIIHDLSRYKELEERLAAAVRLKDTQIAEATEDAKDAERSDIGKELHDNVNQLLGASRLYLDMAKRGGKDRELYLSRSSEYTLSAIEEIRKLTKGLTTDVIKNLGLKAAIEKIIEDTMETNPLKISCAMDFTEENADDKFKLNIFRIVQEQLNNILKHAKAKNVTIRLSQNKNTVTLMISDDGIGFDTTKKQKGIGLANIKSRALSYKGTAGFVSQPGQGCVLTASFPFPGQ